MEKTIMGKLEWNLTVPPYMLLARFVKASIADEEGLLNLLVQLENMVYFLAELAVMSYSTTIMYCPSMVVAAVVYVARQTLHKSPAWTETLKQHTQFREHQLIDCANLIVTLNSSAVESKLQVVVKKYSKSERYAAVALSSPATSILALSI